MAVTAVAVTVALGLSHSERVTALDTAALAGGSHPATAAHADAPHGSAVFTLRGR
jgi:hypothetical protein